MSMCRLVTSSVLATLFAAGCTQGGGGSVESARKDLQKAKQDAAQDLQKAKEQGENKVREAEKKLAQAIQEGETNIRQARGSLEEQRGQGQQQPPQAQPPQPPPQQAQQPQPGQEPPPAAPPAGQPPQDQMSGSTSETTMESGQQADPDYCRGLEEGGISPDEEQAYQACQQSGQ